MQVSQRHIERFERFRSGWGFIATLSVFIAAWLLVNTWIAFDPELFKLNLVLSIETAFALPIILMAQKIAARAESDRVKEVLASTHELLHILRAMAEDVEEIQEEVRED